MGTNKDTKAKIDFLADDKNIGPFLERNGLELTGLRRAVRKEFENGYPKESRVVRFKTGAYPSVTGAGGMFLDGEEDDILKALRTIEMPEPMPYKHETLATAPPELKGTRLNPRAWDHVDWSKDRLTCALHNERGEVIMIEQRWKGENGKGCARWTYFNDFVWRREDPPYFPLWGLDQLKDYGGSVVIHEGPKAASAARRFRNHYELPFKERPVIRDHPWFPFLSSYPQLGWIGGANRADQTDWSILKRSDITRVYIVPDNDDSGRKAAYEIAERLKGIDVHIMPEYPSYFPQGWDIGDGTEVLDKAKAEYERKHDIEALDWRELPKNTIDISYITQSYNVTVDGKDKVKFRLLPNQPKGIGYIVEQDKFIEHRNPNRMYDGMGIRGVLGGRFHSGASTSIPAMIKNDRGFRYQRLTYLPRQERVLSPCGDREFNVWEPTDVEARKMSADGRRLWDELWEWVVPDPLERMIGRRWFATQIARPERMHFAFLLWSNAQGSGKTTLYRLFLRPLVGPNNTAKIRNSDIGAKFNSTVRYKTLLYVPELFAGKGESASLMYNELKDQIDGDTIIVELKGVDPFDVPNWASFYANAQNVKRLWLDPSDRRWLIAQARESMMPEDLSRRVYEWAQNGGVEEVLWWARNYEKESKEPPITEDMFGPDMRDTFKMPLEPRYIPDRLFDAPMTASKMEALEATVPIYAKGAIDVLRLSGVYSDGEDREVILPVVTLTEWIREETRDEKYTPAIEDILTQIPKAGWWYCPVSNSKDYMPSPVKMTLKLNNSVPRRTTSILLSPAMYEKMLRAKVIEVVDKRQKTFRPAKGKNLGDLTKMYGDWVSVDPITTGTPVTRKKDPKVDLDTVDG